MTLETPQNPQNRNHGILYWWFWLHLTREGRDLMRYITEGGTLEDGVDEEIDVDPDAGDDEEAGP